MLAACVLALGALLPTGSQGASPAPAPIDATPDPTLIGARSLGDRSYPTLGNGGYDVRHYDLDLTWQPPAPGHPSGIVSGSGRLDLVTTQDLAELSLDLARTTTSVERVRVDGSVVRHGSDLLGRKLIVPLGHRQPTGTRVVVEIDWTAWPSGVHRLGEGLPLAGRGVDPARVARGFLPDGDGGAFMASQPNGAHTLFPSNDHPTDKATFTIRLTTPAGMLGVATGDRVLEEAQADGSTTSTWESRSPVATHVLALGVGRLAIIEDVMADGTRLRSAVPSVLAPIAGYRLADLAEAVTWMTNELSAPLPFGSIGVQLVPPGATRAVLEGQTLILADATMLDPRLSRCAWQGLLVHEVAHQWFGDSVSIVAWDEKWLSEGHATWYQRRFEAESGCDALGFDARMTLIARRAQAARDLGGPPARPRTPAHAYDATVYDQGALALEALRREVGDAAFRVIERTWLERYADASASTDEFIALASEIAGRDLAPFLEAWLRGDEVPPLPGDPGAVPSPPAILRPEGTAGPAEPED